MFLQANPDYNPAEKNIHTLKNLGRTIAGTESAFDMTLKMSKAMAMTGARCLKDAAFLEQVRNDFNAPLPY